VLVSSLVRELVAGPGIEFIESCEVELKGLEGSHQLFAVDLGSRAFLARAVPRHTLVERPGAARCPYLDGGSR